MIKTVSTYLLPALFITLFSAADLSAQYPGGGQGNGGASGGRSALQGMKLNIGHIYGKIVDAKTKKGVEFASVAIYKLRNDSLIGGQLTETNGEFSLDNLPLGGYNLKVTFLGYKTLEQKVIVTPNSAEQDLGNIAISEDEKTLGEVTITAEKSTLELKPDKKVFNVEKDLSSRGGTAIDVMEKLPGVSTDANGNVTLRNLTPIIYVDGKPTTLTMDQIPADQIEKIEVITNPSAKYEADATGGIINVVLKKNHQPGYNGMVTAAIGTNDQYNGSALINVREKKFGFMLAYNLHGSTSLTTGSNDRTNYNEGTISQYINEGDQFTLKRVFQTGRVGFDYYINNHNTLSLTENGVFGNFTIGDNANVATDSSNGTLLRNQTLNENQAVAFRNFTTNLSLVHTYVKPDKQWSLDFSYNRSHAQTDYLNNYALYNAQGSFIPYDTSLNFQSQSQDGSSHTDMLTAQWDFDDPINANMKLEFGARSQLQVAYASLTVTNIDSAIDLVSPNLSSIYRTESMINAAYITFSHTIKGFSYQLGLRFEETYFNGTQYYLNGVSEGSFPYYYPSTHPSLNNILDCFFPSISLSQKFGDKHELQFNVTRKINRPGFRQLAPFISNSTPYGYSVGNPGIQPEFDNKAELNYDLSLAKFTWLSSVYGSYNQQPITPYTYISDTNANIIVSTFENAKNSFTYGWENTFKIMPVKGLDITLDANLFYNYILSNADSQVNNTSFVVKGTEVSEGYSYVVKGIISYKLPWTLTAQVNGNYEAAKVVAQGHTLPLYWMDASLAKDFGVATLTLAVSDVLNTKSYGTYYNTLTYTNAEGKVVESAAGYTETYIHRRDPRYARLAVSFKFGKVDSSIFKQKNKLKKEQQNQANPEDLGF